MKTELPRERIDWSPRINYEACLGDRACYDFCHSDVFNWDGVSDRPLVANPNNYVLGCDSCGQLCPAEAISFPSKDELRATIRQLKAELATAGAVTAGFVEDVSVRTANGGQK